MNGKYKEYYQKFKELREKIKNKEAVWADMEVLRLEYMGILSGGGDYPLKFYTGNTLRQGCLLYDEFMENGVIKDCDETEMGTDSTTNIPKTVELKPDGSYISERIVSEDLTVKNKEEILKIHGYDPKEFKLISCKHSIWQQGNKKTGVRNLYSSKITVQPLVLSLQYDEFELMLNNLAHKYENPFKFTNKEICTGSGRTVILSYNDLHWGRYYSKELTNIEYDKEYEFNRILGTMEEFVERNKNSSSEIDEIVLVLGSDFFNSDCYGVTTGHKHKQDNSMNFKDIFSSGLELCLALIQKSKEVCEKTCVVVVPGNHGENEDFILGKCLQAFYNSDDNTTVMANSNPRKYLTIGNTLVGFTHGNKEKNNLSNIMASEVSRLWGLCQNRMWITGHIHSLKESIIESNGTTVYSCPSLALDDEWTKSHGYTSSKRMMGFTFDFNGNLISTEYYYSNIAD